MNFRFKTKITVKIIFVIGLLLSGFGIYAQSAKKAEDLVVEAKKQLSAKNYQGTINICNQILTSDPGFKDAHLVLADVYSSLDSVNLEILHLNKAGEIGREWDVVFRLGEAYFKKENFSEALRYYNIYSDFKYIPEKRQFLLACKIASCKFSLNSVNNPDEYWPVISSDGKKLVFVRHSDGKNLTQDKAFLELVPDSVIWNVIKTKSDSVVIDNEGIQNLSSDSKIIFFTACNRAEGLGDCDIYFAKFENGKWGEPLNAGNPVNSSKWEAQPFFSPERNLLYFSSDRNGGKGKKDLWKAELTGFSEDGSPRWKEPVNLGSLINTSGNEISPFLFADKRKFYFASDGLPGLGGIDLFSADLDNMGNFVNVKNLGYPINTINDDDELTLSSICDTVYFSSARQTDRGMEIFAFNLDRGLAGSPIAYVKAKVTDAKTKKPVQTLVKVEYQPFKSDRFQTQETNENGETMLCLLLNRNYVLNVTQPGYLFTSKFVNESKANSVAEPAIVEIELQPIEIGAEVQLYNIYFETDSFRILPQSDQELQKLAVFLNNNVNLKIEIQGHTDSSGNAEHNRQLSERRAKSVADYLVDKGIKTARLKYSGYGDKVPIASNETPEGRMLNRRTTIKIIEK